MSSGPVVSVAEAKQPERCAFCHDDLEGDDVVCPGCQTVLHHECRAALPECPTLGCRHSVYTLRGGAEPGRPRRPARSAFRRALANVQARRDSDRVRRQARLDEAARHQPFAPAWGEGAPSFGPERDPVWRAVRPLLSPCVVLCLAGFFVILSPLLWFSLLARRRASEPSRPEAFVRSAGETFFHECVLAPLLVFSGLMCVALWLASTTAHGAAAIGALVLVLLPAAWAWWRVLARAPRA